MFNNCIGTIFIYLYFIDIVSFMFIIFGKQYKYDVKIILDFTIIVIFNNSIYIYKHTYTPLLNLCYRRPDLLITGRY